MCLTLILLATMLSFALQQPAWVEVERTRVTLLSADTSRMTVRDGVVDVWFRLWSKHPAPMLFGEVSATDTHLRIRCADQAVAFDSVIAYDSRGKTIQRGPGKQRAFPSGEALAEVAREYRAEIKWACNPARPPKP